MNEARISAIAAVGKNRELGKDNDLIWKFGKDWERMKELIAGHPLIMGRKTYESIDKRLSNQCIIISSQSDYAPKYDNAIVVDSLEKALQAAKKIEGASESEEKEAFIFGGGSVYEAALPQTERLYLTEIDAEDPAADTHFPEYKDEFKKILGESSHEEGGIHFRLLTLERG